MTEVTIDLHVDLVTRAKDGAFVFTLIEEGPWDPPDVDVKLLALTGRISDCVTALINGRLAERFPASKGCPAVIQVNSFETPREHVASLLVSLQSQFTSNADIQQKIEADQFISSLSLRQQWVDWATVMAAQSKKADNTESSAHQQSFLRRFFGGLLGT